MIGNFKDGALEAFYVHGKKAAVAANLRKAVKRKLDILNTAHTEADLRVPPGNRFEHLTGREECSIRVNRQWRLIFKWEKGEAVDVYLDPHAYRQR